MQDLKKDLVTGDPELALSLVHASKWLKMILSIVIVYAYFTDATWLTDIIVISVVVSLILPLVFFDVFIQKLLEYNTQKVEERLILNAKEANKHFDNLYKKSDG